MLTFAFIVNISGNSFIQTFTSIASLVKIVGLAVFAIGGLWIVGFTFEPAPGGGTPPDPSIASYIAAVALTILAFKGFTTITNSGSEIVNPQKNVGRAITISILMLKTMHPEFPINYTKATKVLLVIGYPLDLLLNVGCRIPYINYPDIEDSYRIMQLAAIRRPLYTKKHTK